MKYIVLFNLLHGTISQWPANNSEYRIFDSKQEAKEFIEKSVAQSFPYDKYEILSIWEAKEIPLIKNTKKVITEKEELESITIK